MDIEMAYASSNDISDYIAVNGGTHEFSTVIGVAAS
jgi:hypothetical protein